MRGFLASHLIRNWDWPPQLLGRVLMWTTSAPPSRSCGSLFYLLFFIPFTFWLRRLAFLFLSSSFCARWLFPQSAKHAGFTGLLRRLRATWTVHDIEFWICEVRKWQSPRNWECKMRGWSTACWHCKRFLAEFSTSCISFVIVFSVCQASLPAIASRSSSLTLAAENAPLVISLANVFCRPLSSFNPSFSLLLDTLGSTHRTPSKSAAPPPMYKSLSNLQLTTPTHPENQENEASDGTTMFCRKASPN